MSLLVRFLKFPTGAAYGIANCAQYILGIITVEVGSHPNRLLLAGNHLKAGVCQRMISGRAQQQFLRGCTGRRCGFNGRAACNHQARKK